MRHWDKLRVFYFVAKAGSFTKAEDVLHVCQPAISRTIMDLEYHLKVKLFDRHPRGLNLTPQGQILLDAVSKAFAGFKGAQIRFQECDKVQGPMTLVTSASVWLMPYIGSFLKDYPDIRLTIIKQTRDWNLEDADAGVCPLIQRNDIIQTPLVTFQFQFYGHPAYFKDKGTPRTLEALNAHHLLTPHPDAWPLEGVIEQLPASYIQMSSLEGLRMLAEQGLGIALLPSAYARGSSLIPLSLDMEMPTVTLYYGYVKALSSSKRVKAFGEHLEKSLA